jgi:SAM-dependent methyltransferase
MDVSAVDKQFVRKYFPSDGELGDREATYGELEYKGLDMMMKEDASREVLIDLGCGTGRTLAHAVALGFRKAKGIELVSTRVAYGATEIAKLPEPIKTRISIQKGDIFTLTPEYFCDSGTPFIWCSNLCFSDANNAQLFQELSKNIPHGSVVFCSKKPQNSGTLVLQKKIESVPMSWARGTVYKYQALKLSFGHQKCKGEGRVCMPRPG